MVTKTAAGPGARSIDAWWAIMPTATEGFSLTLQLCYTPAELGALDEGALRFWRYHEGDWALSGGAPTLTMVNGHHCASISGVAELSVWTLATEKPMAVSLAAFSAVWQGEAVLVTWETASELDNLGFNLYRGPAPQGPWTQLNTTLIPAQNPGAVFGGAYEWLDTDVPSGSAVYYRLEDVDVHGVSTFHGPIGPAEIDPSVVRLLAFGAGTYQSGVFILAFVVTGVLVVTLTGRDRRRSSKIR